MSTIWGTVHVAGGDNWTDVATIYFDIVDHRGLASFLWITYSDYWDIYDDDNLILWSIGQFEDQINSPLPVELSSFTASLLNNNSVQLKWITATETNNFGFEVERVSSSTTPLRSWEKIAFVNGNGNSSSLKEYTYTDKNPTGGSKYQYRLKQIDNDGQFEYSKIVEVEMAPNEYALYQNYPNPFNPSTKISWQSPIASHQLIKIYDILGNEITTVVDEFKDAGRYEINFDAINLASGIYIYKLTAGNYSETKKMLLLR